MLSYSSASNVLLSKILDNLWLILTIYAMKEGGFSDVFRLMIVEIIYSPN